MGFRIRRLLKRVVPRPLTRIEGLTILLLLSVLLAVGVPAYLGSTTETDYAKCRFGMRAIADAERIYRLNNPKHLYAPDLATLRKKMPLPTCPTGGMYTVTLNRDGTLTVHCTVAAHNAGVGGQPCGFTPGVNTE